MLRKRKELTMSDLTLDVGQANEIKLAARRAGATNADLKRLSEGNMFKQILPVLRGNANVVIVKHVIDCDVAPYVPYHRKVKKHRTTGKQLEWDPGKIKLYFSEQQNKGCRVIGFDLYKEFASLPVINANVLDYLFSHPDLIPKEWKGKKIFFWGTVYEFEVDNSSRVRYLNEDSDAWGDRSLDSYWYDSEPAALLIK